MSSRFESVPLIKGGVPACSQWVSITARAFSQLLLSLAYIHVVSQQRRAWWGQN